MIRAATCAIALAATAACGVAPDDETDAVSQAATNGSCPAWMCGMNSPVVDNFGFHELNLDHLPELESGFKFDSFTQYGLEYELHVDGDTIYGTRDNLTIKDLDLIGAQIHVSNDTDKLAITITDLGRTPYWAHTPSGALPSAQTYTLKWGFENDTKLQDLCSAPPVSEGWDAMTMDTHASVVFAGERVDAKAKTVAAPDARWFDIGCAGSTLAKLHLTGQTQAAQAAGFASTIASRQTTLKMLSADYCGDGTPFTVAGMPLVWADDAGTMKISRPGAQLEARWTELGASCLMKPRVTANPTALAKAVFPNYATLATEIAAHCTLMKCSDTTLAPDGPLVSANPAIITLPPIHFPLLVHP